MKPTMDKTTAIIGGSKGIGSIISNFMIDRGDRTYILSRGNKKNYPLHISIDLSDTNIITRAIKNLTDKVSMIDYLVFSQKYRGQKNNWENELKVSLQSTDTIINLLKYNINTNGSIVIIGSPAGQFIVSEQPVEYHVAKAAIGQLTRFYAVHLGAKKIRVNSILPGTIMKPENENYYSKNIDIKKRLEKIIPLKNMGTAEDVAELTNFLCSDRSTFITGQNIFVDGGLSIVGQETIAKLMLDK
jgi:NAD(P)-dependent dehydrogenase (short-subunit alcohol dehydrogenase family)